MQPHILGQGVYRLSTLYVVIQAVHGQEAGFMLEQVKISQVLDEALIVFDVFEFDLLQGLDGHLAVGAEHKLGLHHSLLGGYEASLILTLLLDLTLNGLLVSIEGHDFSDFIVQIVKCDCGLPAILRANKYFH